MHAPCGSGISALGFHMKAALLLNFGAHNIPFYGLWNSAATFLRSALVVWDGKAS